MIKILNLTFVILLEYQNIKIFLQKFTLQIGRKKFSWTYAINDLNGEEIVGTFYEKKLQKINQKEFRIEKNNQEKRP